MRCRRILIFSAAVTALFCVLGLFCKPYPADEYYFYNSIAGEGFIQAQISSYVGWTGRVLNTFLMYICASFRLEEIQPVLPFISVITYILAVFSLLSTLIPDIKAGEKLSLSFLACALTLCFIYSLHETFYWIAGMPYFWSGTLIILALSLAVKAFRGSVLSFVLCITVLFLNGTILEQTCVFEGIIAFLAVLLFTCRREKSLAFKAGAFWLASVAGFCVMYFAPGTSVRMMAVNQNIQLSFIAKMVNGFIHAFSVGVLNTLQFFAKPLVYAVILFIPANAEKVPPADDKLSRRLRAWHIAAAMFVIGAFMQFMMGVISDGSLPERGVSLSLWLMGFTWIMLWVFIYRGKLAHSEGFRKFCVKFRWPVLILSVVVSANFIECVSALRIAAKYAGEWEARIGTILSQREKGITMLRVPRLKTKPELIFEDIPPSMNPPNKGTEFARYYGAESIYLVPDELSGDAEAEAKLMSWDLEPYGKLAENGDVDAMLMIGDYRNPRVPGGKPEAKNLDEALKWYTMGAEAGNVRCMAYLPRFLLRENFWSALYWQIKSRILMIRL